MPCDARDIFISLLPTLLNNILRANRESTKTDSKAMDCNSGVLKP